MSSTHSKSPQSASVIMTDQSGRARRQVKFWLDATKPEQARMGAALDDMRTDKSKNFAGFMRNAIRLMLALLAGEIAVLVELFPGIVEAIRVDARADYEAEINRLQAQNEALQATIAQQEQKLASMQSERPKQDLSPGIQAQLDRLESLLLAQGNVPIDRPGTPETGAKPGAMQPVGSTPGNGGLKPLGGASELPAPQFDDDDSDLLDVKKDESAGARANQNFIDSLMRLQAMDTGGDGSNNLRSRSGQ